MNKLYDLTFPQKNIWLVESFYDNPMINILAGSLVVNSDFSIEVAEKTVNKFVELNDGMRIRIEIVEGTPKQYVYPYESFSPEKQDVSNLSEEEINDIKQKYIKESLDVAGGPLFGYLLLDRGNGKGEIFLKTHHIISDAWSVSKMASSLSDIYEKFLKCDYSFEKQPSYLEYIESESQYMSSEKFNNDSEFWKNYLQGMTEIVGLKEKSRMNNMKAKRYSLFLDKKLNELLIEFCKVNKTSPYVVFLTALAIYMHRVTEKDDFAIGAPILNRSNFKEKMMQGMFISTMPVRFKIDPNNTFLEICKQSTSQSLNLFRHQKYPFFKISEEYKKNSGVNQNLYKVMLSYQNARAKFAVDNKYEVSWIFNKYIQDQLEIHIMDLNDSGILNIHFDYLVDFFDDVEIKLLSRRILTIIEDGIKNNKKIDDIDIMSEKEKRKILYDFNNTDKEYPNSKTVIDIFEGQAKKTPTNTALVFEGQSMSYKELNSKANDLARVLIQNGVKPFDKVGIIVDKSFELVISIIATLKLGACYVPIEKNMADERKEKLLKNSNANLVIVDEESRLPFEKINVTELKLQPYEWENLNREKGYNADSPNCILYTSGTTGDPKGAIIVNRNIVKLVKDTDYITFENTDAILQAASTSFDVSLFEFWGALLNGGQLHLIKKMNLINPEYLSKYLTSQGITILWITSALFNQMIEADPKMFIKLRRLFTGGDVISFKHVNILRKNCPQLKVTNCYGPTECTTFSNTFDLVKKVYLKRIPIGRPISNTKGYVYDTKGRLLPLYVSGEYVIAGESVALGYVNDQKMTQEKFIKNPYENTFKCQRMYKTGDIVQMLDGGYIDFIGRRDNQIKIRGYRIELNEIRLAVLRYGHIDDAVVIVSSDEEDNEKKLILFYKSTNKESPKSIIEYLKEKLPHYMIPHHFIQVDVLPINQNGKIDRKKLKELISDKNMDTVAYNYESEYPDIQEIFKKVLKSENISDTDNFFEIGGDSLLAIKLITMAISKDIHITFADLYKYPSIKEIGDMLTKKKSKKSISSDISTYNYDEINEILRSNDSSKTYNDRYEMKKEKGILLTGATGFLGAHILSAIIEKDDFTKVYCLVREKDGEDTLARTKKRLNYYFQNKYDKLFNKRIFVVNGDISNENIIDKNDSVINKFDTIINSAAYVKHYGDIEEFRKVNQYAVENLAKFAVENDKKLIQISTLSVSGNILENGQIDQVGIKKGTIYNETNLYIGQNLDNVYAYTKYMGEKIIYDYIINHNLNAKIMRMGNLTGRYNDGKFQINVTDNAFAARLKTILELNVLPENMLEFDVEFTPVDVAASAIVVLSETSQKYNTFHLFNHNHIKMKKMDKIFNKIGIYLKHITKEEMTCLIEEYTSDEKKSDAINGIISDLNKNGELDYTPNTIIKSNFTIKVLKKRGFEWPKIGEEYIIKYIEELININYINGGKNNGN